MKSGYYFTDMNELCMRYPDGTWEGWTGTRFYHVKDGYQNFILDWVASQHWIFLGDL